jgi:hypothetical protein
MSHPAIFGIPVAAASQRIAAESTLILTTVNFFVIQVCKLLCNNGATKIKIL